ncbi:MAG TPA: ABC transporter substrate-binding protein [Candidatus Binatia bacterium]|nr:ABC transporter substrate-binding protein [Candidatus Binatia bacterium]
MKLLACTLALAFCVGIAVPERLASQELTTIRVAMVPNDDVTPFLYAQQTGMFRDAGLNVQMQKSTSGAVIAASVAGGSFDVGLASMMALITAHVRGIPFQMIAASGVHVTNAPISQLVVLRDSPIKSAADLNGKLVSGAALKDLMTVTTQAWMDQHGGNSETLRFVELPQPVVPAALEDKRIDAGTLLQPVLADAMATGKFRSIGSPFDGVGKRFMYAAWFTTADFAAKNPDAVKRFAEVMRKATVYTNAHPAQTVGIIAAFTGLDPTRIANMTRALCAEYLDPADIQPTIDAAVRYKVIDKGFPARELISQYAPRK